MTRRPVPFEIGPVHFIGIGGIGMSGIAEIMMRTGYTVQGSDAKASANTERLEKLGAKIFIGQDPANVEGAYAIVYSTAVKHDNPEMVAARDRRLDRRGGRRKRRHVPEAEVDVRRGHQHRP